jgi:hypothetical protein
MASAAAAVIPDGRRWGKGAWSPSSPVTTAIFLFLFVVVVGVLVSARWITTTVSAKFYISPPPPSQSEVLNSVVSSAVRHRCAHLYAGAFHLYRFLNMFYSGVNARISFFN